MRLRLRALRDGGADVARDEQIMNIAEDLSDAHHTPHTPMPASPHQHTANRVNAWLGRGLWYESCVCGASRFTAIDKAGEWYPERVRPVSALAAGAR